MTRPKISDPLALWRQALDQVEAGVNAYATRKMADADFARLLGSLSQWPLGLKHLTEQTQAELLKRLDLPNRNEVAALAAAVQRVEDKLDQLLPPPAKHALLPAPRRTRQPPPPPAQPAAAPAKRVPAAKRASSAKGARR
ncbi:MAG TPA: hypothetical protein VLJ58_18720 [Ramlibacter sp.]|nr:hypothetical protein [Ramlibacter sp.]